MPVYETAFKDYLMNIDKTNIHADLIPIWSKYVDFYTINKNSVKHLLVYGAKGCGKYTQILYFLQQLSPSKMMYDRKIIIPKQKQYEYKIRISDIHCELDFSLLGCNAKTNWSSLYSHIVDIASSNLNKIRFIVCLNVYDIHPELLDVLYFFMRHESTAKLSFILVSHSISFLNRNIYNLCEYISIKRPTKKMYKMITNNNINTTDLSKIQNMSKRNGKINLYTDYFESPCNPLLHFILFPDKNQMFYLREYIYNILILNINIHECLLYVIDTIYKKITVSSKKQQEIYKELEIFYEKYYNNYRAIYHLENICIKFIKIIHGV